MKQFVVRLVVVWVACYVARSSGAGQPNIILLIADDLGYGEVGCYGNAEGIETPHLDSLAKRGVKLTQGYATAPNCSPSRAGLFTGRIQTRFGYEFNPIGAKNEDPEIGLPIDQPTLANVLHDAGYTTGLVGKWHLGGTAKYHPQRRGFDEFFGFLHEGHFYAQPSMPGITTMLRRRKLPGGGTGQWSGGQLIYSTHMGHDEPPYDANNPILRSSQPVSEPAHLTDAFTREALQFIERHQDKPFFLAVTYNAVHSPLQAADRSWKRFDHIENIQRRIFAAMLAQLDDSVGEVLQKVRSTNIDSRTMVVFLSDNGGPTRELTSRNFPLRGEKGDVYEGGVRVPFLIQWPNVLPAGKVYDQPVSSLDLLPTMAAAAKAAVPSSLDGVDLGPYLTGQTDTSPHNHLYWRQGNKTALRMGDWKLIRMRGGAKTKDSPAWELYNLGQDISETKNRAQDQPGKLAELHAVWERLDGEMAKPLF